MNIALLTAAGFGSRMHQDIPKQFMHVNNKPLIVHTMKAFQHHPSVDAIIAVTLPAWMEVLRAYSNQFGITKLNWIVGGQTGQESIYNGLIALSQQCTEDDTIIIHDGNRCMISAEIISDSLATFAKYGNAVAAIPCVEAVFRSDDGFTSTDYIPRDKLLRTQTPHTFSLGKLIWAYEEAIKRGITNSVAPCSLMYVLGEKIYFSKGSEKNIKITTVEDLIIFKALLQIKKDDWIK